MHRVTVTLLPDADLSKKMEAEEKAKIEAFRKSLTSEQVCLGHADRISCCSDNRGRDRMHDLREFARNCTEMTIQRMPA